MSRQSKNAKNMARARQISLMHKNGEKGPSRTAPSHGKKWGYRNNPEVLKRLAELAKANAPQEEAKTEKTSGKRILRSAGKAAEVSQSV